MALSYVGNDKLEQICNWCSTTRIKCWNFSGVGSNVCSIRTSNQFAERVQAIEAQKAQAQASLAQAEDLFNSLLQRAFKGELV